MGGKGYRVQIDESLFRGRRKYNRGRFKTGDQKQQETVRDKLLSLIANNKSKRNYGKRVDGPWVFGMVLEKISEVESKMSAKENNKQLKKQFIRNLFPSHKVTSILQ